MKAGIAKERAALLVIMAGLSDGRKVLLACESGQRESAGKTLLRDWDRMITFYEFPNPHWVHLRTTNIEESPFGMGGGRDGRQRSIFRIAWGG